MFQITGLPWTPWMLLYGAIGTLAGLALGRFYTDNLRWRFRLSYSLSWRVGMIFGFVASLMASRIFRTPLIVIPVGFIVAYLTSGVPVVTSTSWSTLQDDQPQSDPETHLPFRPNWDARPRYEKGEKGLFVGRRELLERMVNDFVAKRSGTILISGVRGVGKTALVERALLEARNKLQESHWTRTIPLLRNTRFWQVIQARTYQTILNFATEAGLGRSLDYNELIKSTCKYTRPAQSIWMRFWRYCSPTYRRVQRLHVAARSQLFVLKFNASDIGGALTEPGQAPASAHPTVNPEKLLRALIRKLYMTCHSSRPTIEAEILKWTIRKRKERLQFFRTLERAYNKSISKAYRETISNTIDEAIKRSRSSSIEGKMDAGRVLILGAALGIGIGASLAGYSRAWIPLYYVSSGGAAGVVTYLALSWRFKRSKENSSNSARQAQFSYEYDYSLAQMEYDLQEIVHTLHSSRDQDSRDQDAQEADPQLKGSNQVDRDEDFDPFRCFTRTIIIFDELDKLEDPVRQLNEVITHFKNFFTLSEALFVFITDHEFYEHIGRESAKAQLERHYSPEHTFFTQKLYLRKPEFSHFNETVFNFWSLSMLDEQLKTAPLDTFLTDYVLQKHQKDHSEDLINMMSGWPVDTLTHVYIHRQRYINQQDSILQAFGQSAAQRNAVSLARIWTSMVETGINGQELTSVQDRFKDVGGWQDRSAVAFLNSRIDVFEDEPIRQLIRSHYNQLDSPYWKVNDSVDDVPFTLTDLARALCFQTRNHYFDLYYYIYDYVGSYGETGPVLHLAEDRFTHEHRLWSRYQQLLESAFYYRREGHSSREYFNGLLMESLYRVFDSRLTGESVKIKSVLFSLKESTNKVRTTGWGTIGWGSANANDPASVKSERKEEPPPVTPRDAELINESIIRLLRLAFARKAISILDSKGYVLTNEKAKLSELEMLEFGWNPDCEPIITQEGLSVQPHEQELINFWTNDREKFSAFAQELDKALAATNLPEQSATRTARALINKLKTTAESLGKRLITISEIDARALKADIGVPEVFAARIPTIIRELVLDERESEMLLPANQTTGPVNSAFRQLLDSRRAEFEVVNQLPLRATLWPLDSNCLIYLLIGSFVDLNLARLNKLITKQHAYLLWYVPSGPFDLVDPGDLLEDQLLLYFEPPAETSFAKLVTDYRDIASGARLREMVSMAQKQNYRDRSLGLRAGAEAIGTITKGSALVKFLSQQTITENLTLLRAFADDVRRQKPNDLQSMSPWNSTQAVKVLAQLIAPTSGPQIAGSVDLEKLVERAIVAGDGTDISKMDQASFIKVFTSKEPAEVASLLLRELIDEFIRSKLRAAEINDTNFESLVIKEFGPWLLDAIETTSEANNVPIEAVPSSIFRITADLEKARLTLKASQSSVR